MKSEVLEFSAAPGRYESEAICCIPGVKTYKCRNPFCGYTYAVSAEEECSRRVEVEDRCPMCGGTRKELRHYMHNRILGKERKSKEMDMAFVATMRFLGITTTPIRSRGKVKPLMTGDGVITSDQQVNGTFFYRESKTRKTSYVVCNGRYVKFSWNAKKNKKAMLDMAMPVQTPME